MKKPRPDSVGVVGPVDWAGRGVCRGGSIRVNDVLKCCTSVCVVVEEEALWGVLGEDDSAPGGDVLTRWGSVSNRPELAAEFQFLLFRCWAGHSVAEKSPVAVVSGLSFQCAREEGVGWCGLGAKGGKS